MSENLGYSAAGALRKKISESPAEIRCRVVDRPPSALVDSSLLHVDDVTRKARLDLIVINGVTTTELPNKEIQE